MIRSLAFISVCMALCGMKGFAECGEETLDGISQHGAVINVGDNFEVATRGVSRQENAQLALRTQPSGPAVLQVRYSAAPIVTGTPNAVGSTYSFGANDKHMEVTSSTTSRTDYRQLGLLVAATGPAFLGRFANLGFAATPGDRFEATAYVGANSFTTAEVEAANLDYELAYVSCTKSGTSYTFTTIPNRTPDCSGGSPCNMRYNQATGAAPYTASCVDYGWSMTTTTSETNFTGAGAMTVNLGDYGLGCFRLQETSVGNNPGLHSRWVRFNVSPAGVCSYAYEDSLGRKKNRCAKK
jgi:hypothetical protein